MALPICEASLRIGQQVTEEHNLLFLALIAERYRPRWWYFNSGSQVIFCCLCRRIIIEFYAPEGFVEQLVAHENRHIEALGRDKVAAAEALSILGHGDSHLPHERLFPNELLEAVWGPVRPVLALQLAGRFFSASDTDCAR